MRQGYVLLFSKGDDNNSEKFSFWVIYKIDSYYIKLDISLKTLLVRLRYVQSPYEMSAYSVIFIL